MPNTVNILCHVERLGPTYDDTFVHFSLNLSAAIAFDNMNPFTETDVRTWLLPWLWTWKEVAVLGIDSAGKTVAVPIEMVTDTLPAPGSLDRLVNALAGELARVIALDAKLNAFGIALDKPHSPATVSETQADWKSYLGHVSTYPAPLPQALKLTSFFRVSAANLAGVKELVAAPVFIGAPFGNRGPQQPAPGQVFDVTDSKQPLHRATQQDGATSLRYYVWQYDAGDPNITASLNTCPTAPVVADPNSFVDLSKLWVTKPTEIAEDWTVRLESLLADALDMPRRLLDALQASERTWPVGVEFHNAFLASLRDLANFGLAAPPEGRSLAETLVAALDGPFSDIKTALAADEGARYGSLDGWTTALNGFLVSLDPNLAIPAAPTGSTDLTVYARALEQIYSRLADDGNLSRFFLSEWNRVLSNGPQSVRQFWSSNKDAFSRALAGGQLRRRLAMGNGGAGWRNLPLDLADADKLATSVQNVFGLYFDQRFAKPPAGEYKLYLPPVDSLPPAGVRTALTKFAATFVKAGLLPQKPTADDPGSMSEDMAIQVERLKGAGAANTDTDQTDILRRIAGFGVLLRVDRDGAAWRCLNLAAAEARRVPLGLDPVVAPLRFGYRNGVRQTYLAYRNHPMAARSPASGLSQVHELVPDQEDKQGAELLSYGNPYAPAGPKLEALVHGRDYQGSVFVIGNAGNFPPELTQQVNGKRIPWKFQLPAADPPGMQPIKYRRRVPVGLVRLGSAGSARNGEMERLNFPPVPDNVLPLARSLHVVDPATQHTDAQREKALILLTPPGPQWIKGPNAQPFEFTLRPPSVSIDVWDRWVAQDLSPQVRKNVWARVHQLIDIADSATLASKPDATIDDRAVSQFEFRVTQMGTNDPTQGFRCGVPPIPAGLDCAKDLSCVQAPRITVTIQAGNFNIPHDNDELTQTLTFPAGQVWKIEIAPVMDEAAQKRFLVPAKTGEPVTLFVEVASPLLPADTTQIPGLRDGLNAAIDLKLAPTADSPAPQVQATLTPAADWALRKSIHRVEFLVQRWRWDGRPVCYIPEAAIALADPEKLNTRFVDPAQLQASIPGAKVAAPGVLNIAVQTGKTASNVVPLPVVTGLTVFSIAPAFVSADGAGFSLSVSGSGFAAGAAVQFANTPLKTTFVSATQVVAAVPANLITAAGAFSISVNSGGSTSNAVNLKVERGPAIVSITPDAALRMGPRMTIVVNGTAFDATSVVQWNGAALATTLNSKTQLTAVVPVENLATAGAAAIQVVSAAGVSNTMSFTVTAGPFIDSLEPAYTVAGAGNLTLTINGLGFTDGNPIYAFPSNAAKSGGLEPFDGTLFGSRDSGDYLTVPAHVDFAAPPPPAPPGPPRPATVKPLYQADVSALPGSLYYRVAARVFSRYEGLMNSESYLDSRPPVSGNAERWQRLVIPSRWSKPVPTPVVKLILPLTQNTDGSGTPGLLAVLDEPWYTDTMGGLGEALEWEIVQVALPDDPSVLLPQFGPDPLVTLAEEPLAGFGVTIPPAIGAIGNTFDTSTYAPLFAKASFILPPPRVDDARDLSWYFLKVRLRRVLRNVAAADPMTGVLTPIEDQASPWTQGVWAQLLPPSNMTCILADPPRQVPVDQLAYDSSKTMFLQSGVQVKPVPFGDKPAPKGMFALWALLTRRVVDVFGSQDHEVYVTIAAIADGVVQATTDQLKGAKLRLVETQSRPGTDLSVEKLLDKLFATSPQPQDIEVRIVRVSPPIGVL